MKTKKTQMTWAEKQERARRLRNAKAAIIAILLLAAGITTMTVLYEWEIRAFNVFLWIFGVIGFLKVMLTLVAWMAEIAGAGAVEEEYFPEK